MLVGLFSVFFRKKYPQIIFLRNISYQLFSKNNFVGQVEDNFSNLKYIFQ